MVLYNKFIEKKQELGVPTYLPTYLVTEHEIASELTVNYGYVGHDLEVQLDKWSVYWKRSGKLTLA